MLACRGGRKRGVVGGAAGRQDGGKEGETTTEGACRGVKGCVGGVVGCGRRKACVMAIMRRNELQALIPFPPLAGCCCCIVLLLERSPKLLCCVDVGVQLRVCRSELACRFDTAFACSDDDAPIVLCFFRALWPPLPLVAS